ncbi:MAG: hypothetical protein NTY33_04645 [Candidatus Moranbacteria bacterium]|nr:hypothetical protein [Candidatus Moranbacteria bacterium]
MIKRMRADEVLLWEIGEDALLLAEPNRPSISSALLKERMLGQIKKMLATSIPEENLKEVVVALRRIRETVDSARIKQSLADKVLEKILSPHSEKAEG